MSYKIDRLDDFGRGVTSINGKTCFVSNALVNEDVELVIEKEKSKFSEGKTTKIINKSEQRKELECPYFYECGGCNIMHMNYDAQLDFKKKKVEGVLSRFAGINNIVKEITPSKEFIYRNKVTLKVKDGKLGYFKDKSYNLVSIDKCLLCRGIINETIRKLNELTLNNIEEVIIRSNDENEVLLCLKGNDIDKEYFKDKLDKVENIVVIDNGIKEIIKGKDYIIDKINDLSFKVSVESFFQVNSFAVTDLYNKALEYANLTGNENVLDLYCGTGTIGMFLSKNAKNVFGVEINESAVKDANYNKELNNISNIEFLCSDVGLVKNDFKDVDLVVIDPPRAGLGENAIKNILDINPKMIVYVSCDPVTLARDLNILKNNYDIKEITAVDMFPNTYHIESVAVLIKKWKYNL